MKRIGLLAFCFILCSIAAAQEFCWTFDSCEKCNDAVCTWCAETSSCIRVYEPCSKIDSSCVLQQKVHNYLIAVTIGADLILIVVMVVTIRLFYLPRRSRILAKHTRRTSFMDTSAFSNQEQIKEALSTITEQVLWVDVSLAKSTIHLIICVGTIIFFLPFSISFVAAKYTVVGWLFTTILALLPGIAFVIFYTTDKGQYTRINILTQRGAYIINTPKLWTQPIFTPYSAMIAVAVSESYGGIGSVMFAGKTGFKDIPSPHNAMRIIKEQIGQLPQFAQQKSQAAQMLSATENAPLLSGDSPNVF